jgi:ribosome maturation factor RimP
MANDDVDCSGVVSQLRAKTPIEERIVALIAPVSQRMGFEIVRVRLTGAGRPILQIMVDRADRPLHVDDCAELSHTLSALLDVADPIDRDYVLEVSSPGVDRPLTRIKDFQNFAGFEAKVALAQAIKGRKRFRGILMRADHAARTMTMDVADLGTADFAVDDLAEAKLVLTDELIRASLKGEISTQTPVADGATVDLDAVTETAFALEGEPDARKCGKDED